jgi:hypothetical protein
LNTGAGTKRHETKSVRPREFHAHCVFAALVESYPSLPMLRNGLGNAKHFGPQANQWVLDNR